MKILVLCCLPEEYNNSSMLCVSLLCKGFIENGHSVALASPEPDENNRYYNPNYNFDSRITHIRFGKRSFKRDISKRSVSRRSALFPLLAIYRKIDLFGRSITTLKYVDELIEKLRSIEYKPDMIISTSDPKSSHLLGNKIKGKKIYSCPFVQYWGDPLTLDIANQSVLPKWIKKIVENSILKRADVIAYVSPLTLSEQKEFFKKHAKKMIFSPTPCEIKIYEGNNRTFSIGYFGSYNSSVRNIIPLYESVSGIPRINLYIIGDSDVKLESKNNIVVINRVPAEKLKKYYDVCDVIVDIMNFKGSQIPAKIYRDAGTNKEILLISDSKKSNEIIDYFGRFNRYTICNNNKSDISFFLEEYLENGTPLREPLREFEYVTVSRKLLKDILTIM